MIGMWRRVLSLLTVLSLLGLCVFAPLRARGGVASEGASASDPNPSTLILITLTFEYQGKVFGEEERIGSGAVISEDGLVVTAKHVIEDKGIEKRRKGAPPEFTAHIWGHLGLPNNGWTQAKYELKVVSQEPKADIAVLRFDEQKPWASLQIKKMKAIPSNARVRICGFPLDQGWNLVPVNVTSTHGQGNAEDLVGVEGGGTFGMSGAPVLDLADNGLVGVFKGGASVDGGGSVPLNFFTPITMADTVSLPLRHKHFEPNLHHDIGSERNIPFSFDYAADLGTEIVKANFNFSNSKSSHVSKPELRISEDRRYVTLNWVVEQGLGTVVGTLDLEEK
jgi:S1-C subfamily serine protease